ncbi:hypothetical protein [Candidatus Spongiihabitans sp.]|uniref:hypothetical protein n=1 Tax=Candidatus Spongiihabitans sp. TaxID=3101308 RepID=UPI003C7E75D2
MNITKPLKSFMKVIVDEVGQNPEFAKKIAMALGLGEAKRYSEQQAKRRSGRRTPAVLDPVVLVSEGSGELRKKLDSLGLEQLRDIVAECGMDPGKLVMKWKNKERVIDHIVEVASARSKKGEAFR